MKKPEENVPVQVIKGSASVPDRLRILNRKQRHAVLATDAQGQPYPSLVAYALTLDGKGVLFATPRSTRKYKNVIANNRVSLLIDTRSNTDRGYLQAESLTILGKAHPVRKGAKWISLAEILIKKHPGLAEFVHFPATALIYVEIMHCVHVSQFQTVSEWHKETSRS
ncbi:MAG: pyridoxamine 5'-phosphate oxidase family protein [Thermodesulfovibrionales bacterium]|nr:pyridoxamine 5'-phosphate oxidase family protein [Thermodesulfovibrionales bacterium]